MNKKLFGIKLSTYLQLLACFFVAFCVWFFAKYIEITEIEEAAANISAALECI